MATKNKNNEWWNCSLILILVLILDNHFRKFAENTAARQPVLGSCLLSLPCFARINPARLFAKRMRAHRAGSHLSRSCGNCQSDVVHWGPGLGCLYESPGETTQVEGDGRSCAVIAAARHGGRSECHPTKGKTRKATNQRAEAKVASRDGQEEKKKRYKSRVTKLYFFMESAKPLVITYSCSILWLNFASFIVVAHFRFSLPFILFRHTKVLKRLVLVTNIVI